MTRAYNYSDAINFIRSVNQVGSRWIREAWRQLLEQQRSAVKQAVVKAIHNSDLKKRGEIRNGAVRIIVALLPDTFSLLGELLRDQSSPLWYEVQFTALCSLDRAELSANDQKRTVELIRDYLRNVSSDAGYAAWKAGDLLGDEWRDAETVKVLEDLLSTARYATGRKAALHGIQHALNNVTSSERERLFALIKRSAEHDRSRDVRNSAKQVLRGVGCGPRP